MRFDYDPEAGAGYVRVREGTPTEDIVVFQSSVIVDLDAEGRLLGVEILGPADESSEPDCARPSQGEQRVYVLLADDPERDLHAGDTFRSISDLPQNLPFVLKATAP